MLIAAAVLLFLAISAQLARFLSTENAERDAIVVVLKAETAGNEPALLAGIAGCAQSVSCRATEQANIQRLRRPGAVKILTTKSATAYALSSQTGKTRVAWTVIGRLPVVQCVVVRRHGSFLGGMSVDLLSLSAPISNTGDC
ncbi:MAG TPA: hypothetical protein VLJ42_04320 [Solirubrobacteraceae bacterium]|nr:hypothetical protein [Solirubrobacteraceae bacterium]